MQAYSLLGSGLTNRAGFKEMTGIGVKPVAEHNKSLFTRSWSGNAYLGSDTGKHIDITRVKRRTFFNAVKILASSCS